MTGNNGILTQAIRADDETRAAAVQEKIDLWKTNKELDKKTNTLTPTAGSQTDLLDSLEEQKLLTGKEKEELETTGQTMIGDRVIQFSITLEGVYTDDMIGQSITYSANEQKDWIIFGKDENGNILITTKAPVPNGFQLKGTVENWLSYEDDLKEVCSKYVTQIQGRADIKSRSITMDDINYVTGFKKPDFSNYRYTFAATPNEENRVVNYYYPNLSASSTGNWQAPNDESPWIFPEEFDSYFYHQEEGKFIYGGLDGERILSDGEINENRFKYVVGDSSDYEYVIASRSVDVYSGWASFRISSVGQGYVDSSVASLCYSDADNRL